MPKLIMTLGLPASGKTTWAKEEVLKSGGKIKRVNKDDLRAMIDNSIWSKSNEAGVLAVRDFVIKHYLSGGFTVIVDDTNLAPSHEETLRKIAEEQKATFEVKSFLDVSLATCIVRNAQRANPVPETAIRSMFRQFLKPKPIEYVAPHQDPTLPHAIIVDIDGTLAHMTKSGRLRFGAQAPYMWEHVGEDAIDEAVLEIVHDYARKFDTVILASGRKDICREQTLQWLYKHKVPFNELHMRKEGDDRNDAIVKEEIYEQEIEGRFNIDFVLDDRDRVVAMWRSKGLKCLQVAEGDF